MARPTLPLFLLLSLGACAHSSAPLPPSASAQPASGGLDTQLQALGYQRLALDVLPTGHLLAIATVDDDTLRMVVDTGAGGTVLRPEAIQRIQVQTEASDQTVGGIGGAGLQVRTGQVPDLQVGDMAPHAVSFSALDLAGLNAQFGAAGVDPIDGILGADWLTIHGAVLSMADHSLYLRAGG